jgi:polyhydroxybutyrate depolymerase
VTLDRRTITVDGIERAYWLAAPNDRPAPLLLAFHGLGTTGPILARWTGLDDRGPAAGFLTAFPDALAEVWDDHGTGRRDGADDAAFVSVLIEQLAAQGLASTAPAALLGLSNGATFIERLARTAAVRAAAMILVSGSARRAAHAATPEPQQTSSVLGIFGTADPMVPYGGGRSTSPLRRLARRKVARGLLDPSGHESVAPELIMAEWVKGNQALTPPTLERLSWEGEPLPIDRVTWAADPSRPESRPVVLYRVIGGGHGWPGGSLQPPARLWGPLPQQLDATAIALDFARRAIRAPAEHDPRSL